MKKVVGNIISKNSGRSYPVLWNSEEQTSWISRFHDIWEMVCTDVRTADDAISCAQKYIDSPLLARACSSWPVF